MLCCLEKKAICVHVDRLVGFGGRTCVKAKGLCRASSQKIVNQHSGSGRFDGSHLICLSSVPTQHGCCMAVLVVLHRLCSRGFGSRSCSSVRAGLACMLVALAFAKPGSVRGVHFCGLGMCLLVSFAS